jgi:hypothetical protein
MLRLLADENLNGPLVRGLLLRGEEFDIVRVQDVGLSAADDAAVLAWAAQRDRIVVTHDRATMPDRAWDRIGAGESMPGLFVLPRRLPAGEAIEEFLLVSMCSEPSDWQGRVVFLPL